jgi:hypothetical protein
VTAVRKAGRARSRVATLLWLVAVGCALVLAVGALLVALEVDAGTEVAGWVVAGAGALDLGTLAVFHGAGAAVENRLTSWGLAALLYLLLGRIADWLVRPRPSVTVVPDGAPAV